MTPARARASLARALRHALGAIDLEARTRAAVLRCAPRGRVTVIAVGKAAPAMIRGACAALGARVDGALCIAPDGVDVRGVDARVVRAGHPVPDARSVRAAELALRVSESARSGVLLALVSGGASALLCAPYRTTLARKAAATRALLRARATIAEINVVRRHASRVKGGGLARAAQPARVVTIVVSDVIDGAPYDVGSGPTLADPTTVADARAVLARYGVAPIPLRASYALPRGVVRVVASPGDLARAARASLDASGFSVRVLPPRSTDVAWFASRYAALARGLAPGEALVRAAEPTVAIDVARPGRGGRASHLAAVVAGALPADVFFLAAASDGVDGASDAAGALVEGGRWRVDPRDVASALARFDTATLHARAGTSLACGPTGHNLADLHVLARRPR